MTNSDGKSLGPRDPGNEPGGKTIQHFARRYDVSEHTIKRAVSHGLIATIQFGDRPIVPSSEVARIDREGLPKIPPGYKRKTRGFWPGGKKAKAKTADTAALAKTKSKPEKTTNVAGKVPPRRLKRAGEDRAMP